MEAELVPSALGCGSEEFLDLLDREAGAADYEGPLHRARTVGAGEAELARLERARAVALRIRDELEQRRRREAELTALFETASDLAGLHDLDSVLRAIVRRARLLLGTDVAYMTLHDPAKGDTYMRVTSGSTSPAFQRLRLKLGEGLGGLVAERGTPYATSGYLGDGRFLHTGQIDGGVADEGLVAILGAPLLFGDVVIGVLFAADRRPRTFGPAEVSLLCSLAAHAAIAIDAARLLDETRAAVAELNAANRLISEQSEAVERASQAHRRFTELVLSGGTADDVTQAVAAVLGSPAVMLGEDDAPVAASVSSPVAANSALARAAAQARTADRTVRSGRLWAVAATAGSEHLGTLILAAGPDLPDTDRRILERAAMVTALLLLLRKSVTEAEHRVRGELLGDLLTAAGRDAAALHDRAQRLGADLDQPYVLVVADGGQAARSRIRPAAAHLAATRHGLAAEHEGMTVLLLPGTDAAGLTREASAVLAAACGQPVTAGAAPAAGNPGAVQDAYTQARRCLQTLLALGRSGQAASSGELGFLGLLLADRKEVPAFVKSAIGPLLDYDTRKGSDLVRTVEVYFEVRGSVSRARQILHVHVNTVTQRLDRVTRLLGQGWQDGERALEIQVAIRLHRAAAGSWA